MGEDLDQVFFDVYGIDLPGEVETLGDAGDVGVDDNSTGDVEAGAEDDIGGFAGSPGYGEEVFDVGGDFAFEDSDDALGSTDDVFGFVVVKAGGVDVFAHLLGRGGGEVFDGGVFGEEGGGDFVDALVSTLSAEDGGDEKFPGVGVVEGAGDVGIHVVEDGQDLVQAGLLFGLGSGPYGSWHEKLAA